MKKKNKLEIYLCCIARLEHDYIKEFVEHYLNIGVTKIILFDNGQGDEPKFDGVLSEYTDKNLVKIISYRDRKLCQLDSYNEFYKTYSDEFDWCIVCDCDEFLYLKEDKDLSSYLNRKEFDNKQVILPNWLIYGDNGHIAKESNAIVSRFTKPSDTPYFNNNLTKCIIRGGLKNIEFTKSVHMPDIKEGLTFCTENGITINGEEKKHFTMDCKS